MCVCVFVWVQMCMYACVCTDVWIPACHPTYADQSTAYGNWFASSTTPSVLRIKFWSLALGEGSLSCWAISQPPGKHSYWKETVRTPWFTELSEHRAWGEGDRGHQQKLFDGEELGDKVGNRVKTEGLPARSLRPTAFWPSQDGRVLTLLSCWQLPNLDHLNQWFLTRGNPHPQGQFGNVWEILFITTVINTTGIWGIEITRFKVWNTLNAQHS